MTIEFRAPRSDEEQSLRELFTEAFGDPEFTSLFFHRGYSPERCLAAFEGGLLAALHWFDCTHEGRKAAYIYGIAAFRRCRGRGIGSELIRAALDHLRSLGYGPLFLVPAELSLFGYYERFGFRAVGTIHEERIRAAAPTQCRRLTVSEYADLRRSLVPHNAVIQEGACLELLDGYAAFYATDRAVSAVTGDTVWELLGDAADAPGLLAALDIPEATVRTPGNSRPFAMALGAQSPAYLGLALD